MGRRILSGLMVAILVTGTFVLLSNVKPVKADSNIKVAFRLLAIDGYNYTAQGSTVGTAIDSTEQLIEALTTYGVNWQNASWAGYQYVSYIHLLTNSSVPQSLEKYWTGETTPANINSEITGFLATTDTGAGESNALTIRILYYNGHTHHDAGSQSWYMCCYMGGNERKLIDDTQLSWDLGARDLHTSRSVLLILDTCFAAGYFNKLSGSGRAILAACPSEDESYAWTPSSPDTSPLYWGWFTGNKNTIFNKSYSGPDYPNGYSGPVGIIGTISWSLFGSGSGNQLNNPVDTNGDGWLDAAEVFNAANATVVDYTTGTTNTKDPYWGRQTQIPQSYLGGVVEGEIPFVMYTTWLFKWNSAQRTLLQNVTFPGCPAPIIYVSTPPTSPWPSFHNLATRIGWTSAPASSASLLWNTSTMHQLYSSVALADGCAFVGTFGGGGGMMYALNLADGRVLWNSTVAGRIYSSPTVSNGSVFFGTDAGWIYALYEDTGRLSWEYQLPTGENITSSPCVDGYRLFVGSIGPGGSGRLYALNVSTGGQCYNYTVSSGGIYSSPAVADGLVFFGTNGTSTPPGVPRIGWMYALSEENGQLQWSQPLTGSIRCSPAVAYGRVFGGTCSQMLTPGPGPLPGMVFALDEHNGTILWTYPEPNEDFLSSPAVYGGGGGSGKPEVIVGWRGGGGGGGGGVYALNESNGFVLWMRTSDAIGYSSPAVAGNGLVYVGTETGILLCLNATDGSQKWSYTTGSPIEASPSITDDHVVVGSMSGEVYCWGPSFPEHDVQVSKAVATIDSNLGTITTNYTITNIGNVGETVNVDLAYNTTDIGSPPESPMPTIFHTDRITIIAGEHADETYTTTFPKGNYTITVTADPVPGETNMTYNDRVAGTIQVGNFDVGIMSVTPSKYLVNAGTPITVNIIVKNEGNYTETFNVTLYEEMLWGWENDTFPLYVFTGVTLMPGSMRTLTVSITFPSFPWGVYGLKAYAWPVPGETHVSDNTCTGGYIRVLSPKIYVHWFYGHLGCGVMPL